MGFKLSCISNSLLGTLTLYNVRFYTLENKDIEPYKDSYIDIESFYVEERIFPELQECLLGGNESNIG